MILNESLIDDGHYAGSHYLYFCQEHDFLRGNQEFLNNVSLLTGDKHVHLFRNAEVPWEFLHFETAVNLQLILFFVEYHYLIVSSQSQKDLVSEIVNFSGVVGRILGNFIGNYLV
jgi:hypothetical protein